MAIPESIAASLINNNCYEIKQFPSTYHQNLKCQVAQCVVFGLEYLNTRFLWSHRCWSEAKFELLRSQMSRQQTYDLRCWADRKLLHLKPRLVNTYPTSVTERGISGREKRCKILLWNVTKVYQSILVSHHLTFFSHTDFVSTPFQIKEKNKWMMDRYQKVINTATSILKRNVARRTHIFYL